MSPTGISRRAIRGGRALRSATSPSGDGWATQHRGFTTIELLVVLVVLVIMSTVVMVSMQPALDDARSRSGYRMVASAFNYARSYAITHRTQTRVTFDSDGTGIGVEALITDQNGEQDMMPLTTQSGRHRGLPAGLTVERVEKPGVPEEERYVAFSQLGQAEEAVIMLLDARGKGKAIVVDPVTGHCRIEAETDKEEEAPSE
jgi:prepilin-type N-terminal cleavage/methylation domain-containing protein